jgi:hypothetical protein
MKLVTKYQIPVQKFTILADNVKLYPRSPKGEGGVYCFTSVRPSKIFFVAFYMFNVYKNQLIRQTGSRNPTGPKTLLTIWYTYMTLVTNIRFLPSTVTEKNATKNILDGRKDGWTEVKQYTPLPLREAWV